MTGLLTSLVAHPARLPASRESNKQLDLKRATTALGSAIAIPHVRTMQSRGLVMGFSRSTDGLPFGAPDDQPAHLFFSIIGPRHEEAAYLKIYREIAQIFRYPNAHQALMEASNEWEVIRVLEGHVE